MEMCNQFELPIPYPQPRVMAPNAKYAQILSQLYAGKKSELTAIAQYSYQEIFAAMECPQVAQALFCIAMIEMNHLHMLGELILMLGKDPQYLARDKQDGKSYWSAHYASYSKTIPKILMDNIQGERDAIKAYSAAIALINDEYIVAILQRIIMDEELHAKTFSDLLAQYNAKTLCQKQATPTSLFDA